MNIIRDIKIYQKIRDNLGLLCVLLIAVSLRFLFLDLKAPHFDEGVYGFFVQEIWRRGFFPYDPTNFHGPTYYYAIQIAEQILGRGVFAYRFASGICSVLSVYYIWRLNKFFGEVAILAALAVAVSPASAFYSRYTMHESMFILFQILFAFHYFEFIASGSKKSAVGLGIYAALMMATKETAIIFLFCFLFSSFVAELTGKKSSVAERFVQTIKSIIASLRPILLAVLVGLVLSFFIFSGLLSEPSRFNDFFRAYSFWTKTGTQHLSGHEKAFNYWVELLIRYEWPAFGGLLVSPFLLFFGSKLAKFFALFAVGNLLAYSIIPYKTPWCILGIVWPLCFLMGFALVEMRSYRFFQAIAFKEKVTTASKHYRSLRSTATLSIALCLASLILAIRINFFYFQDSVEPYVYVQTSEDVNSVTEILSNQLKSFPEDLNMNLVVGLKATWPLPWLLSSYTHVIYREMFADSKASEAASVPPPAIGDQRRQVGAGDVILIDQVDESKVEPYLTKKYLKSHFRLRDSYGVCTLFLSAEKFQMADLTFSQGRSLGGEASIMSFSNFEPPGAPP